MEGGGEEERRRDTGQSDPKCSIVKIMGTALTLPLYPRPQQNRKQIH
jgi:hypothetical protein